MATVPEMPNFVSAMRMMKISALY